MLSRLLYNLAVLNVLIGVSGAVLLGAVNGVATTAPLLICTISAAMLAYRFRVQGGGGYRPDLG